MTQNQFRQASYTCLRGRVAVLRGVVIQNSAHYLCFMNSSESFPEEQKAGASVRAKSSCPGNSLASIVSFSVVVMSTIQTQYNQGVNLDGDTQIEIDSSLEEEVSNLS